MPEVYLRPGDEVVLNLQVKLNVHSEIVADRLRGYDLTPIITRANKYLSDLVEQEFGVVVRPVNVADLPPEPPRESRFRSIIIENETEPCT